MPQSAKANTAPKGKLAWTVRRVKTLPRPAQVAPLPMRRYHMSWLAPNGDIDSGSMTAPAVPLFEKTFNSFARGALIPTPMGLVAIEDLFPGDSVLTVDGTVEQIDWIGSMVLDLHGKRAPNAKPERLYRITSDAFGLGRPSPDLLLGAGALYCPQAGQVPGFNAALKPVTELVDGLSVIEITPISTMRSYHIRLRSHRLIRVNGLDLESCQPDLPLLARVPGPIRDRFMAMFPYLSDVQEFGPTRYQRTQINAPHPLRPLRDQ